MLELNQVQKLYDPRGIEGIHQISFSLPRAHILSILGPTGCGKTTLLNLIQGKLKPDSGTINSHAKISTLVEQFPRLKPEQTVWDFLVSSGMGLYSDQFREHLDELELTNQIEAKVETLSGGQKQRLLLIKALTPWPDLLLLDEPFANLDEWLKFDLLNFLVDKIKEKKTTVLWVTHSLKDAFAFSDKCLLLHFGKMIQFSSPKQLYQKPQSLFAAQFTGAVAPLVVSRKNKDSIWTSPLGELSSLSLETNLNEALWLIRPENFSIRKNSPYQGKVLRFYPQGAYNLVQVQYIHQEIEYEFMIQTLNDQYFNPGESVFFEVHQEKTHLISL